ncbi:hypothetical protein HAX54_035642 [Datura stramonium]|uniref:Uncharacterized protein n=1 Tax=Datura stramonium TaxID=4076 RepID=A0ABS8SFL7_DATST|nr:hypothetical protein [Datura stramonium]
MVTQETKWSNSSIWCYTLPQVNSSVDTVFEKFDTVSGPYWESPRKLVDEKYKTIDFPFEPVNGCDHNGPFNLFKIEKVMDMDSYFIYLRSWSAYQTAKEKGVESEKTGNRLLELRPKDLASSLNEDLLNDDPREDEEEDEEEEKEDCLQTPLGSPTEVPLSPQLLWPLKAWNLSPRSKTFPKYLETLSFF